MSLAIMSMMIEGFRVRKLAPIRTIS